MYVHTCTLNAILSTCPVCCHGESEVKLGTSRAFATDDHNLNCFQKTYRLSCCYLYDTKNTPVKIFNTHSDAPLSPPVCCYSESVAQGKSLGPKILRKTSTKNWAPPWPQERTCVFVFVVVCVLRMVAHSTCENTYGVATISRMLKNIGLFCKRDLQERPIFCKETYIFKHPTHRSHPIGLHRWMRDVAHMKGSYHIYE